MFDSLPGESIQIRIAFTLQSKLESSLGSRWRPRRSDAVGPGCHIKQHLTPHIHVSAQK